MAPVGYCDQCVDHETSRETSVKWERRDIALRELCTAAAVTIPLHHLQIAGLRLKEVCMPGLHASSTVLSHLL